MNILIVSADNHMQNITATLIIDDYTQEDVTAQLDEVRKNNKEEDENYILAETLNCSLLVYCCGGYIETYKI